MWKLGACISSNEESIGNVLGLCLILHVHLMLLEGEEDVRAPFIDSLDGKTHGASQVRWNVLIRMRLPPLRFSCNTNNILIFLELNERVDGQAAPIEARARKPDTLDAWFPLVAHGHMLSAISDSEETHGWDSACCPPTERAILRDKT